MKAGELILANRYTTSNAVHQASKLPPEEQKPFVEWLFDLEYGRLGLPKPALVVYLDMPTELTERLMRSKRGKDRHPCGHPRAGRELSAPAAAAAPGRLPRRAAGRWWTAPPEDRMRTAEEIHEEVYGLVRSYL